MAITVKYLESLGIEKETAEKIFAERSKEIELEKEKYSSLEDKFSEKEKDFESITKQFEELKESNKSSEDFKQKFEQLQSEIAEKEKKAKQEREAKEKEEHIASRFNDVLGDKKFNHEAIKAEYLRKFTQALDNKDFTGKSDADIFHELTKDDAAAFSNVQAFHLEGGSNKFTGTELDDAKARAVMGLPPAK